MTNHHRPIFVEHLPAHGADIESLIFPPMAFSVEQPLVELVIRIDATRAELGRYLYSKLYYITHPDQSFDEAAVICFEVKQPYRAERIQIALPPTAVTIAGNHGYLRLRVDALPYSQGTWQIDELRLVAATDNPALTVLARRVAHRQWVREQVLLSEAHRRVDLPHYPESVSIELTPVCNLRCPHCSSHGMPHLHRHHNRRPEMPLALFERLAEETFPHVSVVSLVGRGEPMLASDDLWRSLTDHMRRHDVRMSCVTNGTRIRQRIDADLMPWIHELIFSFDGGTPETFAVNREGAQFNDVFDNLCYYHQLRSQAPLTRRPQLTISWTLKRNNVAELADFVRKIAPFEPDLISIRHLVVFQDKEQAQSLLYGTPDANRHLREAYAELDRLGLRHESPPLLVDQSVPVVWAKPTIPGAADHVEPQTQIEREPECNWMHRTAIIMADGEVTTCGKHYGQLVGQLSDSTSLWDIWNGCQMRSLRDGFGKPHMWAQCKACWLREIKWHSQRQAKDLSQPYSLEGGMDFTQAAWDYREYAEL